MTERAPPAQAAAGGWKAAGAGRLASALRVSLAGLAVALRGEAAFRLEVAVSLVAVPLGLLLGRNGVERALLVGSVLLVLVVELLNSAVEAVVDRISLEHHPLAGRAKDLGSAAVFLAIVLALAIWALVVPGPGRR